MVELDVLSGIWPGFHEELLKNDTQNPLPSQLSEETQPPLIINSDGEQEQAMEKILRAEKR